MRREPILAVLLCLVGALLVLVAASRSWAQVEIAGTAVLPGRGLDVTGTDLAPGLQALGLVALAGVLAIPATRRWGRVVVGLVLLMVAAGVVAVVAGFLTDVFTAVQRSDAVREAGGIQGESPGRTLWPYACGLGGLWIATAGLFVAVRGRHWAALGRRYEPPAAEASAPAGPAPERELWEALDRGEDPTAAARRSEGDDGRIA